MGQGDTIYNREDALARLDGDEALFDEMAAMFVAENESYCLSLSQALSSGDVALLRREAHTVKSLFATFSYEKGRALALGLEQLAAAGQLAGAPELTAGVLGEMKSLKAAFEREGF